MKTQFQPSQNCFRVETAHRAAVIIDGEAYFRALHEALSRARRSIFIIGWDLHSEVRLIRNGDEEGYPAGLGALLDTLVDERPRLEVYLLSWDFAMIYAMEREFFPRYKLKWRTKNRVHFSLDGHHPVGGSQHQKMVVIVMPEKTGGWLEQHTMDVLRGRLVGRLREADAYDRLRIYYPRLAQGPHAALMVHAKVMVIDDAFLRVGSSNLSNRSMGLDSECDLAIAGEPDDLAQQKIIAGVRSRLLAEHLGCMPEEVERAVGEHDGLIAAVEALRGGERTLMPLAVEISPEVDNWVPEAEILDPEKPVSPEKLLNLFVSPREQPAAFRQAVKIIALVTLVAGLAALWRWTPLGDKVDLDSARALVGWIQQQPLAPLLVAGAYVLGGIVALPVTLMIIATVLVFDTWLGLLYALAGSWLSALAVFGIGRWMGRAAVRRFAGSLINRLSRRLSEKGLLTVITLRIVPVAPFSVINLIAGVSEIRWRDFALGSLVGMLPGVVAVVLLANRIAASLSDPELGQVSLLLGAIALVGLGLAGLRRWLRRRSSAASS